MNHRVYTLRIVSLVSFLCCGIVGCSSPPSAPEPLSHSAQAEAGPDAHSREDFPEPIATGPVSLIAFLKHVNARLDAVVTFPSSADSVFLVSGPTLHLLGEVEPLNYEIAEAILKANGFTTTREALADAAGTQIMHVAYETSPAEARRLVPAAIGVDEPDDGSDATLVLRLKHTEADVVSQCVHELAAPHGNEPQLIQLADSKTLIIHGKVDLMLHVQQLFGCIDIPVRPSQGRLPIVEVYNASAEDIAATLCEILGIPAGGGPWGKSDKYARVLADSRTDKIIIDTTDAVLLDTILRLIDDLDVKID